jgi:acetylornithine deacetylase
MQKRFRQSSISTVVGAAYPGLDYHPDSQLLTLMQALTGDKQITVVPFGTDAGYIQQIGIETVVFGPGSIEQAHRPDEFIQIRELERGQDFMDRLIQWAQNA